MSNLQTLPTHVFPYSWIGRQVCGSVCVLARIFNHPHNGCADAVPTSGVGESCGIGAPAGDHQPPESPTHASTLPDIDSDADAAVTQLPARMHDVDVPAADHQPPGLSMHGSTLFSIDSDDDLSVAQLTVRKKSRIDEVRELSLETQRGPGDGRHFNSVRATDACASEYMSHGAPNQVIRAADVRPDPAPIAAHITPCGSSDMRWICTTDARSSQSNAPAIATVCDSVDDARQVRWACTVLRGGD